MMMAKASEEKFILGVSLGFNASACIMSDQRGLIAAISEERFNGVKNTKEIPIYAISACMNIAQTMKLEKVAVCHYGPVSVDYVKRYLPDYFKQREEKFPTVQVDGLEYLREIISRLSFEVGRIYRVEHHLAHGLSAMCFHGFPYGTSVIFTLDGFGDGTSGRIMLSNGEVLSSSRMGNSVGLVYQFVTGALGFKEHQHEGKITGLAAFGEPKYIGVFGEIFTNELFGLRCDNFNAVLEGLSDEEFEKVLNSKIEDFDLFLRLKKTVYAKVQKLLDQGAKKQDIASSVQFFTELIATDWLFRVLKKHFGVPIPRMAVYLAGGVFANVKLNQRIKEMNYVDSVFVAPAMGDEGTCVGAAFEVLRDTIGDKALDLFRHKQSMFLGTDETDWNEEEVKQMLGDDRDKYSVWGLMSNDRLAKHIAVKLANKEIVCIFRGRMEFGPRALCNRSILFHAEDATVNQWLNEQLGRTEFMPFAPFCKAMNADRLFEDVNGGLQTAEYMTITFDCKGEFLEDYPAAAHVDNTARPQFVTPFSNALAYQILDEYEEITGKVALINTSFNLHNSPIIESAKVAVDSWKKSNTDVLVIGNVIIERREK